MEAIRKAVGLDCASLHSWATNVVAVETSLCYNIVRVSRSKCVTRVCIGRRTSIFTGNAEQMWWDVRLLPWQNRLGTPVHVHVCKYGTERIAWSHTLFNRFRNWLHTPNSDIIIYNLKHMAHLQPKSRLNSSKRKQPW